MLVKTQECWNVSYLSIHLIILAEKTKPGQNFPTLQELVCMPRTHCACSKISLLKVENSAKITFRFSPIQYRAFRLILPDSDFRIKKVNKAGKDDYNVRLDKNKWFFTKKLWITSELNCIRAKYLLSPHVKSKTLLVLGLQTTDI